MAYTRVRSKFRPFSYDEMVKPLLQQTLAQRELENAYGELDAKASVWENLASNEDPDSEAYQLYSSYANDLRASADQLAKEGLNATSRRSMLNMKARYNQDILPIETAFNARNEEAKAQYEGRAKGIIYEGDASTSSLDRYLHNPAIRYRQANSQEGFKRVATVADALSKGLRDYGNGKRLDAYTKTWLQEHGYKDTEVAAAISEIRDIMSGKATYEGNSVLRNILNDEIRTAGLDTWNNRAAVTDYYNRVAPALYRAVGQTEVSPYADRGAIIAAEEASKRRLIDYQRPQPNTFPVVTREIPVGAAKDTSAAMANLVSRFSKLGVSQNSPRGTVVRVSVGSPTKVTSPGMAGSLYTGTKFISTDLYVYSQGDRLKTRSEFIKSGKNKEEQAALGKYYDAYVQPILDKYNGGTAKGVNYSALNSVLNYERGLIEESGTSTFIDAVELPFGDLNETKKALSSVASERVTKLVPSEDGNGFKEQEFSGSVGSVLADAEKNGKGVNSYMSMLNGQEGYIIKSNDDIYFLSLNRINSSLSQDILMGINEWRNADTQEDAENYQRGIISRSSILLGGKYNRPSFDNTDQVISKKD